MAYATLRCITPFILPLLSSVVNLTQAATLYPQVSVGSGGDGRVGRL